MSAPVTGLHVLACLLALTVLSGCATARQVAADHPTATRVIKTTLATSAVLTTARVIK